MPAPAATPTANPHEAAAPSRDHTVASPLYLYAHLPFCRERCPYCDFYTLGVDNPRAQKFRARYVDLLRRELALALEANPRLGESELQTIYLGGGTPSLHSADELAPFFDDLRAAFPRRAADFEATMEANPGSLLRDGLEGYAALGINRVSLGAQSLDDAALAELGRAHGAREARDALDALAAAPFLRSFSADLIFGFPRQTVERLRADFHEIVDRGAPHVSVYGLTLHPGTPYEKRHQKGDLPLPDEETVLAMFRETRRVAVERGFEAYEFSNFAKPGHRSRHNAAYWTLDPVLPLGASACGYLDGRRVENPRDLDGYAAALGEGRLAWRWEERLSGRQLAGEVVMCALRRAEGVEWAWLAEKCGVDPRGLYAAEFADAVKSGWLDEAWFAEAGLRLTPRGVEMSDEFFASLY